MALKEKKKNTQKKEGREGDWIHPLKELATDKKTSTNGYNT